MIYLDAAATTPLHPEVKKTMVETMDVFGNDNSKHAVGFEARKKLEESMERIATVLDVSRDQLVPTYSGTDGNRKAIWAARKKFGHKDLFCSAVEHSSISDEILETNYFDPRDFSRISSSAKFIALMSANNETGAIYPAEVLRKRFPEALILRDYAQTFGKGIKPDFENCDFGTFAPQKFHGPKGIGLLYIKNPEHFTDLAKDTHTRNIFLIAGMAKAFELLDDETPKKLKKWTDQIEEFIRTNISDYKIHESKNPRVPGILNVAFRGVRGSELMTILSEKEGICISTGSACTSDVLGPTRVIQFIEKDPNWQFPIRIGLHSFLTDAEVTDFCAILEHYVGELRSRNF